MSIFVEKPHRATSEYSQGWGGYTRENTMDDNWKYTRIMLKLKVKAVINLNV